MSMTIDRAIAAAKGLTDDDQAVVKDLVATWYEHYQENILKDSYYFGKVSVKDLGISVSPELARKLKPKIDWAAKCVDWWADRTQFEGVSCDDDDIEESIYKTLIKNDAKNLIHKVVSCALRHCCAFLTVTAGDQDKGEPPIVVSGYPATAAAALWDDARKRIRAGLVVVERNRKTQSESGGKPSMMYVFTDENLIILRDQGGWVAEYVPHSMGRVPMEQVAYHASLERPFGLSRISPTVMSLVDDAQRELMNMSAAAAFSAWPQKFLLGVDKNVAEKLAKERFSAFIGSILAVSEGRSGKMPEFGQLPQLSMQPHTEYMRSLAATFSGATGVPLSSLGVISDNPSSAEAIYAAKEDAVVDIQSFINAAKRSIFTICVMIVAAQKDTSFIEALETSGTIDIHFRNPAMPSVVSQSDAMVKQVSAIPWLADSDVTLRELGYSDEQIHQLKSDRRRSQALSGAQTILKMSKLGGADVADDVGAESV